ncbi:hypothetical protein F4820DRAFT_401518 [Hypoxylon rubiginosum]|uniref:Uncharacterized protein n=1 Tax=Hypoxylon rubiginosum TaxID=110542 RepID=A0ACB9ZHR2_9PEZI|nr:hypothetical protein F4820DRAFT_401518 [Hypoxylon rubiginosum]
MYPENLSTSYLGTYLPTFFLTCQTCCCHLHSALRGNTFKTDLGIPQSRDLERGDRPRSSPVRDELPDIEVCRGSCNHLRVASPLVALVTVDVCTTKHDPTTCYAGAAEMSGGRRGGGEWKDQSSTKGGGRISPRVGFGTPCCRRLNHPHRKDARGYSPRACLRKEWVLPSYIARISSSQRRIRKSRTYKTKTSQGLKKLNTIMSSAT